MPPALVVLEMGWKEREVRMVRDMEGRVMGKEREEKAMEREMGMGRQMGMGRIAGAWKVGAWGVFDVRSVCPSGAGASAVAAPASAAVAPPLEAKAEAEVGARGGACPRWTSTSLLRR